MGPAGIKATVYARGLTNAAAFALDTGGRLFVATAGYSKGASDGIYLLEKAGSTPVKVISGLKTPLGLVWSNGTLYVSSSAEVDAYTGFQGSAFLHTTRLVTFPAGAGELNNLVLGPSGRIELGISAPCDHCQPASPWSGTVVSFRQDGSDLRVEAKGIRAPFGLAYDASNSELLVSMNQRDDLGKRTPGDWLGLVESGQNWGFPACYGQGGSACDGVPKPIAVLDPHAAAGGVALAGSDALVSEWALGKVQRVARASGEVTPWLSGLKNPLPVVSVPDGSLLVGDWKTGLIYRIAKR